MDINKAEWKLTEENYSSSYLEFRDRQAGVSEIYSPKANCYYYNVYCVEREILKEIYSAEFEFLSDALKLLNSEFHSWELKNYEKSKCSSCANK
jgi:hypothetical protein